MMNFNCVSCPAINLRTKDEISRIKFRVNLNDNELLNIGKPNLILLCESFPNSTYIYDIETPTNRGLRNNLKLELFNDISDRNFINRLSKSGILIYDCAYCPIHKLGRGQSTQMRLAATICLKNHNLGLFTKFPEVPIITIFPRNRGFLRTQIPGLANRIKAEFQFSNLNGLKSKIISLGLKLED